MGASFDNALCPNSQFYSPNPPIAKEDLMDTSERAFNVTGSHRSLWSASKSGFLDLGTMTFWSRHVLL